MTTVTPWGQLLADARAASGLSAYKLSQLTGVTDTGIRHIESGVTQGRPETIARLAKILNVSPARLRRVDRRDAAHLLEMMLKPPPEPPTLEEQLRAKRDEFENDGDYLLWLLAASGIVKPEQDSRPEDQPTV